MAVEIHQKITIQIEITTALVQVVELHQVILKVVRMSTGIMLVLVKHPHMALIMSLGKECIGSSRVQ